MNVVEFISPKKSMLIAPAGHGKTHAISECLKHTTGKQLILTHTHAGIASIKEKLRKAKIATSNFQVETITGFAQKYVLAFYRGSDIPAQENSKEYYSFIIKKATVILKSKPVSNIIRITYSGIFVDEYQDCTLEAHNLVLALADILPTRILGDYLQGIFGFDKAEMVDLNNTDHMGDFLTNPQVLETPWRWKIGQNEPLGTTLKEIRQLLEKRETINLTLFKTTIEIHKVKEIDLYDPRSSYCQTIRSLLGSKSLLIIHPDSKNLESRKKVVAIFNNAFKLLESIDNKDFYSLAKQFDKTDTTPETVLRNVSLELFNSTGVNNWFNDKGLVKKRQEKDKARLLPLQQCITDIAATHSLKSYSNALSLIKELPEIKCYRRELHLSLSKALESAHDNQISANEAMINHRNIIRRVGRKVYGKCIGTTLLTKGLEFDTVVILNAHKFDCPKHLYVALTRASKRLVIFTQQEVLNPYLPIPQPSPQSSPKPRPLLK